MKIGKGATMNREILFRGKRIDNGEWVYGDLLSATLISKPRIIWLEQISEDDFKEENHEVDPAIVGQFTGLTDKNGKEIWEGDICRIMMRKKYGHQEDKLSNPIGFVEYTRINVRDDSLYAFDTFNINGRSIQYLLSMELEVIGNIHDNPELIK